MKSLLEKQGIICYWPHHVWIRHLQSSSDSMSHSSSSNNPSTSSVLLTVFFLMLGFCFLNTIWRYCRLQMIEERDERRSRATLELTRRQIAAIEARSAQETEKMSPEEKRKYILQAFAPFRMVLEEKHFPTMAKETCLAQLEEGIAERNLNQEQQVLDEFLQPTQREDSSAVDEDAVVIEIPLAGLGPDFCVESERPTRIVPGMCSICLSAYQVGSDIVWSSNPSCDHVFHEECIENWLIKTKQTGDQCPCCRRSFIVHQVSTIEEGNGNVNDAGGNNGDRLESTY